MIRFHLRKGEIMKSAKAIVWEAAVERSSGKEIECMFFYDGLDPEEHLALLKKIAATVSKARILYKYENKPKDPFFREMMGHPKLEMRFISREAFEADRRTMPNPMEEGIMGH